MGVRRGESQRNVILLFFLITVHLSMAVRFEMLPVTVQQGKPLTLFCNVMDKTDMPEGEIFELHRYDKEEKEWCEVTRTTKKKEDKKCRNQNFHSEIIDTYSLNVTFPAAETYHATYFSCVQESISESRNTTVVVIDSPIIGDLCFEEGKNKIQCKVQYFLPENMNYTPGIPSTDLIFGDNPVKVERTLSPKDGGMEMEMHFQMDLRILVDNRKTINCSAFTIDPRFTCSTIETLHVNPPGYKWIARLAIGAIVMASLVLVGMLGLTPVVVWLCIKECNSDEHQALMAPTPQGPRGLSDEELLDLAKDIKQELQDDQGRLCKPDGLKVEGIPLLQSIRTLGVLQEHGVQTIEAKVTPGEKTLELIKQLMTCSLKDIILFVWILIDIRQDHQIKKLSKEAKEYLKKFKTKGEIRKRCEAIASC